MAVNRRRASAAEAQKITAWSFSRWSVYESCPRQARYKFIDRLKEKEGPALKRGKDVHSAAEAFLRGTTDELVPELSQFTSEFGELRDAAGLEPELEWAFTRSWDPTGWFAKGPQAAWCRVKVDAYVPPKEDGTALIIDFKTGRERPSHQTQLELYALGSLLMNEDTQKVTAEMWYTDAGDIVGQTFTRADDGNRLIDLWEGRTKAMLSDMEFRPTPSSTACRWCSFSKKRGGPCDAGR